MGNVSIPSLSVQSSVPISTNASSSSTSSQTLFCEANSSISINVVSNSHLLREAPILLLYNHWSIDPSLCNSENDDHVSRGSNSNEHLVLLDGSIGYHAVLAQIQKWRSLQPSPYVVVIELKNDTDLILSCIEAEAHGYALQGASSAEVIRVIYGRESHPVHQKLPPNFSSG